MVDRAAVQLLTLAFVRAADRLLLLRVSKDKRRLGGLWNGIGGHVQPGEDIREAARREIREEAGLDPLELQFRGVIHVSAKQDRPHVLFLFTARAEPEATEQTEGDTAEGELGWFRLEEIPWDEVVPDLRAILPRLLESEEILFGTQELNESSLPIGLRFSS